jgi:hypothetical protein
LNFLTKIALYGFLFLLPAAVFAQDWRLSASYGIQSVSLDYVPNRNYTDQVGAVAKGMIEVELERYLFYRFYIAGKADYLLHNQQDLFIGGPIDFEQVNVAGIAGLQWDKFGIYGGISAGSIWDVRVLASNQQGDKFWVETTEPVNQFTTGFLVGIKYYLLNFIRLQAELTHTQNPPMDIIPESSFTESPAFRSFDFNPVAFTVGISIGIPWNRPERPSSNNNEIPLPPLVEGDEVSFSNPLKDTFITSGFGPRWNSTHQGVDLDASLREDIYAAESGIVVKAGQGRGYGKMVRIRHANGFETVYAHMSRIRVKQGQHILKGEVVGKAGNTGTSSGVHLHFEILKDSVHVNPLSYIRF